MAQTKRELVKAALDCKPVDRVPVGFWHHFLADQRHADALAHHSAWVDNLAGHDTFYKSWKPDFVKIMTDGFFLYPHGKHQTSGQRFGLDSETGRTLRYPDRKIR